MPSEPPGAFRVVRLPKDEADRLLDLSIHGLSRRFPEESAEQTLTDRQRKGAMVLGAILLLGLVVFTIPTLVVLMAVVTAVYTGVLVYRLIAFRRGIGEHAVVRKVSDADALAVRADDLPIYTVLVPAYDEPEVIGRLLESLGRLDYPSHKLDVKVLLEEDDEATLEALIAAEPPHYVEAVLVPASDPRTKPKACNFGLLLARGEIVTIFDAEDRPEPLQLRRAAVVFASSPEIDCLQARLDYFNSDQNRLTQWFTAEYGAWFTQLLPGLVSLGAPLPLGGTSNHIRRHVLDDVGGWDPYNVTEDADLGIRLERRGHHIQVLDSVTYEEANSDFVNWVRQRSRWHKGYLQTWLVHLRRPRTLYRELGWRGFLGFNLFIGGTPLLALLNPVFWAMTLLWFIAEPPIIERIFPAPVYYPALACWALGNFVMVYAGLIGVRVNGRIDLTPAALLAPAYWVMMSIAAVKAVVQLVHNPSLWEKTKHGLEDTPTVPDKLPDARQPALVGAVAGTEADG